MAEPGSGSFLEWAAALGLGIGTLIATLFGIRIKQAREDRGSDGDRKEFAERRELANYATQHALAEQRLKIDDGRKQDRKELHERIDEVQREVQRRFEAIQEQIVLEGARVTSNFGEAARNLSERMSHIDVTLAAKFAEYDKDLRHTKAAIGQHTSIDVEMSKSLIELTAEVRQLKERLDLMQRSRRVMHHDNGTKLRR